MMRVSLNCVPDSTLLRELELVRDASQQPNIEGASENVDCVPHSTLLRELELKKEMLPSSQNMKEHLKTWTDGVPGRAAVKSGGAAANRGTWGRDAAYLVAMVTPILQASMAP